MSRYSNEESEKEREKNARDIYKRMSRNIINGYGIYCCKACFKIYILDEKDRVPDLYSGNNRYYNNYYNEHHVTTCKLTGMCEMNMRDDISKMKHKNYEEFIQRGKKEMGAMEVLKYNELFYKAYMDFAKDKNIYGYTIMAEALENFVSERIKI